MKGALDVHAALLAADVPHEVVRLPRAVLSADDLPGALDLPAAACGAVRCYAVDGGDAPLVAVLVRAGCVPDPAALLDALGARSVRAATVAEVNAATDFAALLVSPVALPRHVPLLVDAALAAQEVLYVPAGEGRVALGIRSADLLAATGARARPLHARDVSPAERPGWDGVVPLPRVIDLHGVRSGPRPRRPTG